MTHSSEAGSDGASTRITVSVDAMGGDAGPAEVVAGCLASIRRNPELAIILHGDEAVVGPLVGPHRELQGRVRVAHAEGVVTMDEKPSHVVRGNGKTTSMWSCIESVRSGDAAAAVSCGNTGALMLMSMLRLRKLPGVDRPAIACMWPKRGTHDFNIMLDVGADVRAEPDNLVQYALLGAAYYRNAFQVSRPRVGLLNVGTEDHKGRPEIREAHELLGTMAEIGRYDYVGFVEGGDIPSADVDVIVTDGFTGNVALKTAEGTARLIRDLLREELTASWLSKLAALPSLGAFRRLQKRIDPRRVNGGVFLGLNGTVVKSHGASDATGISAAIKLAFRLAQSRFQDRMSDRLAQVADAVQQDRAARHEAAQGASTKGEA